MKLSLPSKGSLADTHQASRLDTNMRDLSTSLLATCWSEAHAYPFSSTQGPATSCYVMPRHASCHVMPRCSSTQRPCHATVLMRESVRCTTATARQNWRRRALPACPPVRLFGGLCVRLHVRLHVLPACLPACLPVCQWTSSNIQQQPARLPSAATALVA